MLIGVVPAYFDLQQIVHVVEDCQAHVVDMGGVVRIGQAQLRQGLINKLDVYHFEAERENVATRIAELKRHMIQTENGISTIL